jgi:hypothetical protein
MKHFFVASLLIPFASGVLFAQGDLNPAGPPGPTMRTLLQLQPRTPISTVPFVISSPGAYYLTGNLAGTDGITIAADSVDLDLKGFTLAGTGGTNGGVSVPNKQINVTIHNGNVVNWGGFGINATNVSNGQLDRLRASGNVAGGLAIGPASLVTHCEASSNLFNGITVGDGSAVQDCQCRTNGNTISLVMGGSGIVGTVGVNITGCIAAHNFDSGIVVGDQSTVRNSSASENAGRPPLSPPTYKGAGIRVGKQSLVIGCVANNNANINSSEGLGIITSDSSSVQNCTANGNALNIGVGVNCNIQGCTACFALGDGPGNGIGAGDASLIRGCVVNQNNYANIVCGNNCRIEDNICREANLNYDISLSGSNNTVVHNLISPAGVISGGIHASPNNAIGTIESFTTLNANANPHANITP